MTDLEKFVNQPGRDKLVKDVRKKINECFFYNTMLQL